MLLIVKETIHNINTIQLSIDIRLYKFERILMQRVDLKLADQILRSFYNFFLYIIIYLIAQTLLILTYVIDALKTICSLIG